MGFDPSGTTDMGSEGDLEGALPFPFTDLSPRASLTFGLRDLLGLGGAGAPAAGWAFLLVMVPASLLGTLVLLGVVI